MGTGLKNGSTIVRTFQYSPFNFKRHTYDATLFGVEKGSVFVVETPNDFQLPDYCTVGCYTFEGFGKVIYNPSFLEADKDGKCKVQFKEADKKDKEDKKSVTIDNQNPFLVYLMNRKKQGAVTSMIYQKVNAFAKENKGIFKSNRTFKSQWGEIRSLAMAATSCDKLWNDLFKDSEDKKHNGYLTHGVAKDDWSERGRIDKLKKFIKDIQDATLLKDYWKEAVVNLASQMAKTE